MQVFIHTPATPHLLLYYILHEMKFPRKILRHHFAATLKPSHLSPNVDLCKGRKLTGYSQYFLILKGRPFVVSDMSTIIIQPNCSAHSRT